MKFKGKIIYTMDAGHPDKKVCGRLDRRKSFYIFRHIYF